MHNLRLIHLYYEVCELYNDKLAYTVQRFSVNGNNGYITDEELITIYLFAHIYESKFEHKKIYEYTKNHWLDWFPNLPSYQAFNNRMNRLTDAFACFLEHLLSREMGLNKAEEEVQILLGDSFPVVTCSGKRSGKVAPDLCDKSYCASKSMWYYGIKVHLLGESKKGTLPEPVYLKVTPASTHDLPALRPILEAGENTIFVLDKAYCDEELAQQLAAQNSLLFTPEKAKRNESEDYKSRVYAYRKQLQTEVSKLRQPVESLFNWLEEKTGIQKANKVRSRKGLWLHIFGKLTAAFCIRTGFTYP